MDAKSRISGLRVLMKQRNIHAYIIPSTDPHQSEYVPDFWRRREWISGFTGSAGDVIVTSTKAALWTDSRYFLQAQQQLAGSGISLMKLGEPSTPTFSDWLNNVLGKGSKIGVDLQVLSCKQFQSVQSSLRERGLELVSVEDNLVDKLWKDHPAAPKGAITIHEVKYAGESCQNKLKRLRKAMSEAGAKAHVISTLDSIAWLFNIRGSDVQYNPVVIAYAIVTDRTAVVYTDLEKVSPKLRKSFGKLVEFRDYERFSKELRELRKPDISVWVDSSTASQQMVDILANGCKLLMKESPIVMFKAVKNQVQLMGGQEAHVRDGAAMVKFLYWLDENISRANISEISAAEKLEEFRAQNDLFRGLSFETIAGYGAHGAIIHYASTPKTNVRLREQGIFLLDSGAQYKDGTTDITRTISLGKPTAEQKEHFTRVLRGHIALSMASFPAGTSGKQLDILARKPLWEVGLNYGHGTGHGVGSYLCVHEGPHRISPAAATDVALVPGMITSNEPGFYKVGAYGIRTENLVYVVEDKKKSKGGTTFHKFEILTLCPIDIKLVDKKLMSSEEIDYLNKYHVRVRKTLTPFLSSAEAGWLTRATRPI